MGLLASPCPKSKLPSGCYPTTFAIIIIIIIIKSLFSEGTGIYNNVQNQSRFFSYTTVWKLCLHSRNISVHMIKSDGSIIDINASIIYSLVCNVVIYWQYMHYRAQTVILVEKGR